METHWSNWITGLVVPCLAVRPSQFPPLTTQLTLFTLHLSLLTSHLSHSTHTFHLAPLTSHISHLTSHISPLTSHVSPLTSHFSRLTYHVSRLTSTGASREAPVDNGRAHPLSTPIVHRCFARSTCEQWVCRPIVHAHCPQVLRAKHPWT